MKKMLLDRPEPSIITLYSARTGQSLPSWLLWPSSPCSWASFNEAYSCLNSNSLTLTSQFRPLSLARYKLQCANYLLTEIFVKKSIVRLIMIDSSMFI
jgi:hypothetical protein